MSRYPFSEYAVQYLEVMRGVLAHETWLTRERRYRRMARDIIALRDAGDISSASPKTMSVDDVRTYLIYRKGRVSSSDLMQEINCLKNLLEFCGNSAVSLCLAQNPQLKPIVRRNRLPSMHFDIYCKILEESRKIDIRDYRRMSAYMLVLLCARTGARNKELRLAEIGDLDTANWIFDIIHVKGEKSYGLPRSVPVHPDIRNFCKKYIISRENYLLEEGLDSPFLFARKSIYSNGYDSNGLRILKTVVENDLNIKFDLRQLRRTFGQFYLDEGLRIESASVLMGHASTKTTEEFYARKRLVSAQNDVMKIWNIESAESDSE